MIFRFLMILLKTLYNEGLGSFIRKPFKAVDFSNTVKITLEMSIT